MAESASQPVSVLVLGGCGFVGRHLVSLLVQKKACGKIRVVDKLMPSMAFMAPDCKAAFGSPEVEFKQADLSRQAGVDKAFAGEKFTYVFNLTFDAVKFGDPDEVYQQLVVDVSTRCGAAAAAQGVARFVDLSTAQVYEPNVKDSAESAAKLKPWTKQAAFKLRAEGLLRETAGLNLVVLRTATIYGPGDVLGLSPRLICAAVYSHLGEKMRFAWDGKLRANTVHVRDVAAACWHVATLAEAAPTYNLSDSSDSDQATIASNLEQIFNIRTSFAGTVASTAMRAMGLKRVAEEFNEKHMTAWQEMCAKAGIGHTTLTPYIDAELLAHNHLACDGGAITATGFSYQYPKCTAATLKEQVETYIAQGLFPPTDGSAVAMAVS